MTVDNFHEMVETQVLHRGQNYFRSGAVLEFTEEEPGHWVARVAGSNEYQVEVRTAGPAILYAWCSCPYDEELYCKHEVAVFFALREDLAREAYGHETGNRQKLLRSPSFRSQVEEVGKSVEMAELLDFIVREGRADRDLRDRFLLEFAGSLGTDMADHLQRLVRQIVRGAERGTGFLDREGVAKVVRAFRVLLARPLAENVRQTLRGLLIAALKEALESAEDMDRELESLLTEITT